MLCFLQSRVSELNQQLIEQVLRYANRKYFQIDVAALTTLVSLNILVMSGQLSIENMEEFLASPDVDTSDVRKIVLFLNQLSKKVFEARFLLSCDFELIISRKKIFFSVCIH